MKLGLGRVIKSHRELWDVLIYLYHNFTWKNVGTKFIVGLDQVKVCCSWPVARLCKGVGHVVAYAEIWSAGTVRGRILSVIVYQNTGIPFTKGQYNAESFFRVTTSSRSGFRFIDHNPHDDVIKWKHFPRYWPFVRGIHRSPVNSLHKGQWRGTLMFSLICAWLMAE